MQTYEAQMQRLKLALNVESDNAFAQTLEISQGAISGAKKRGQVPHSWFFQVSEMSKVSVDWLFCGVGSMRPGEDAKSPDTPAQSAREPQSFLPADVLCPRCAVLEKELEDERRERREMTTECRLVIAENRQLMKENGELKLEGLKLSHRLDTTDRMCREYAAALKEIEAADPIFDEPQIIPSSSQPRR